MNRETQLLTQEQIRIRLRLSKSKYYLKLPLLKRAGLELFHILGSTCPRDLRASEDNVAEIVRKWKQRAREKEAKRKAYLKIKEATQ